MLDKAVCISLHANELGNDVNHNPPLPSHRLIVWLPLFFYLSKATSLGERKLQIQTNFTPLKI